MANHILVVAEKSSVAQPIAKALGVLTDILDHLQ